MLLKLFSQVQVHFTVIFVAASSMVFIFMIMNMVFETTQKRRVHIPNDILEFSYVPKFNNSLHGKTFYIKLDMFKRAGLNKMKFYDKDKIQVKHITFLTTASANHYAELLKAVQSVQKYFPGNKILLYDLGLTEEQIQQMKSSCDVHVKHFNYDLYPYHIRDLYNYAFKTVVLQDALKDHAAIFWLDSSVRFLSSNISAVMETARKNGGVSATCTTLNYIYEFTDPALYRYIPTDPLHAKSVLDIQAGVVFYFNTKEVYENIVLWYVLCGLDSSCIIPSDRHPMAPCDITNRGRYCHRFDQSLLNALLMNHYNFDWANYYPYYKTPRTNPLLVVKRRDWHYNFKTVGIKTCSK